MHNVLTTLQDQVLRSGKAATEIISLYHFHIVLQRHAVKEHQGNMMVPENIKMRKVRGEQRSGYGQPIYPGRVQRIDQGHLLLIRVVGLADDEVIFVLLKFILYHYTNG